MSNSNPQRRTPRGRKNSDTAKATRRLVDRWSHRCRWTRLKAKAAKDKWQKLELSKSISWFYKHFALHSTQTMKNRPHEFSLCIKHHQTPWFRNSSVVRSNWLWFCILQIATNINDMKKHENTWKAKRKEFNQHYHHPKFQDILSP